jgi:rubredoxin
MTLCPLCGSERVISLASPEDFAAEIVEVGQRPSAKCAVCGHLFRENEAAKQDQDKRSKDSAESH